MTMIIFTGKNIHAWFHDKNMKLRNHKFKWNQSGPCLVKLTWHTSVFVFHFHVSNKKRHTYRCKQYIQYIHTSLTKIQPLYMHIQRETNRKSDWFCAYTYLPVKKIPKKKEWNHIHRENDDVMLQRWSWWYYYHRILLDSTFPPNGERQIASVQTEDDRTE